MQFIQLEAHEAPTADHFEAARAIIRSATGNEVLVSSAALTALAEACRTFSMVAFTCNINKPKYGRSSATVQLYASVEDSEIARMHTIQLVWACTRIE